MPTFTYAHKRGATAYTDGNLPAQPPAGTCGTKDWRAAFKALEERRRAEGKLVIQHLPHGEGEEMVLGEGKKKKTRKPAGPSDKRRARGAMVSKLMKEKGMTLAEASRHIKQHGLA